MTTRLLPWVVAMSAGCSLVVGDIELPSEDAVDEGLYDAAGDATPPEDGDVSDQGEAPDVQTLDAALDAEADAAWAPDAEPDMMPDAAPVPDAAPDMMPDAAPPAVVADIPALAGDWHIYGIVRSGQGPFVFEGRLRVNEEGAARLETFGGTELRAETPLEPDPEAPERVQAILFPLAGLVSGTMDPQSGLGVLVNDEASGNRVPTMALLARVDEENPPALPDTMLYAHVLALPVLGVGEVGGMGTPTADVYTEFDRRSTDPNVESLPERRFQRSWRPHGRHQLAEADTPEAEVRLFSVASSQHGVIGALDRGGQHFGLAIAWDGAAENLPVEPLRILCGGVDLDEGQPRPALASVFGVAELTAERLTWPGGEARLVARGAVLELDTPRNLFGEPDGLMLADPSGRAFALLPAQLEEGTNPTWGLALCVALPTAED